MVDCVPEGAAVPGDLVMPRIVSGTIWVWADLDQLLRARMRPRTSRPRVTAEIGAIDIDCATQPVGLVLAAALARNTYFVYVLFPKGAGWIYGDVSSSTRSVWKKVEP